jgi:Phage related hypothetical protein (DUF1799)
VSIFCKVGTQWRTGFTGPIGLDYNVVFRLMDDEGMDRREWEDTLESIQCLEAQALQTMIGNR